VAIVQGNIDQSLKWSPAHQRITVEKYLKQTRMLAEEKDVSLMVWPETALPFYPPSSPLMTLLETLKKKEKVPYIPQKGSTNFAGMRGKLPWPISGKIISPFGKIKNPKFNVYTFNNGIEIQTRPDLEVKAIHDGQVIFADWFEGYGKLVIVDNGGGYYSLYGHLDKIEAQIGKNVYSGNVLGYSGETGSINGYTLYFEIRKDGKPVNPLIWLNKNRRVA